MGPGGVGSRFKACRDLLSGDGGDKWGAAASQWSVIRANNHRGAAIDIT